MAAHSPLGFVGRRAPRDEQARLHARVQMQSGRQVLSQMGGAMKAFALVLSLIVLAVFLIGCGETVSGIGKDISRVGRGVKTIFIRGG